jgi:hypothetical protein
VEFSRIAKNARLGDGSIVKRAKNANLMFVSTDLPLLYFKKYLCNLEGIKTGRVKTQKSGYGGKKTIYKFSSLVDEKITKVYDAPMYEILQSLDKEDLFLWYMDDGRWHKNRHTMHLYSNMLNDEETEVLIGRIEELYGIAPRKRKDRKKDGREFNYIYFPRDLVRKFRPEFKEYVTSLQLESMYYKFGGLDYEDKEESA